jgi:hypothetical protein
MSACAHRRVTIDVYGPSPTTLVTTSLYCTDDEKGSFAVKKWAREEASRRGITLGSWDYVRHDRSLEWEGRVFGEPATQTAD